jgi:hypothetical protein
VISPLNALAVSVFDSLLSEYPDWSVYAVSKEGGDLEILVPAPEESRAGHLVVSTARGHDIWIRFAPTHMSYAVASPGDLARIVHAILADEAFFVVITNGDEWVETALYRPGEEPVLKEGQVASMASWSGRHDKIVLASRPEGGRS